jgi:hypothetical protein
MIRAGRSLRLAGSAVAVALALGAVAVAAGCDGGGEPGGPSAGSPGVTASATEDPLGGYDEAVLGKPLDDLTPEDIPEDLELVIAAFYPRERYLYEGLSLPKAELAIRVREHEAMVDCMSQRGFSASPVTLTLEQVRSDLYPVFFGTQLANPETHKYGYFVFNRPPAEYSEADYRVSGEGFYEANNECVQESVRLLRKNEEAWNAYDTLEVKGLDSYYSAVLTGQQAATQCLAELGFPADPKDYYVGLEGKYRDELYSEQGMDPELQERLAAEELAAAEADWECYRQHVLLPYLRYNLAEQTAALEAAPEVFAQVREDVRSSVG